MTTVFVAGATGFTGREVVRLLRDTRARVTAHLRPDSSELSHWRTHFGQMGAEVDTTPWDDGAMTATLHRLKPEVVFCLIGTTKKRGRRAAEAGKAAETYETIDYGLTRTLVRATVAADGKARFVYLSAAGTGAHSASAYGRARWKAEQEVRSSGLHFTIVRPSFIVGTDRDEPRTAELVGAKVVDGVLAAAGAVGFKRMRDRYSSISNTELAAGLIRLALDPAAADRIVEAEELSE